MLAIQPPKKSLSKPVLLSWSNLVNILYSYFMIAIGEGAIIHNWWIILSLYESFQTDIHNQLFLFVLIMTRWQFARTFQEHGLPFRPSWLPDNYVYSWHFFWDYFGKFDEGIEIDMICN